jgi:archaellum component FlaC
LSSPDKLKLLQAERNDIRKQIDALQKEMLTLENNLGFFARSKGADQLRSDVQKKIDAAQEKIKGLRAKLKLIPNE